VARVVAIVGAVALAAWLVHTRRAQTRSALLRAATLADDGVRLVQVGLLRLSRRGVVPLLVPFVGHGSPRRVQVGARAVLGRPDARPPALPVPEREALAPVEVPAPPPRSRRAVLRSSVSRFLTAEVAGAQVTVTTPDAVVTVRSDRAGYLDATVDHPGLRPGWHAVELALDGGDAVRAPVLVVSPDARLGLVSDVDDTILHTGLTRGVEFLRITLLTEVGERAPLPGAAALYRALVRRAGKPGLPVFYLSTSPWNLHDMLVEFLGLRGFPLGPLLLTDWGPGGGSFFRIGAREHKLELIGRILDEHPDLDLLLVGDTGQLDPEIYAAAAREHPDRIRAIYVRRTGTHDVRRLAEIDALAAEVSAAGVPMLAVDDSAQIAEHAVTLGLLDAADVEQVRAEMHTAARWAADLLRPRDGRSPRAR
jgi:phosphatidate phosphatase APP1